MGYKIVRGWEYQIQNALAVQTHFLFSKKLFTKSESERIDFHFQSEANLGTIFSGASTGFLTRIGFKKLTFDLVPFRFNGEAGFKYRINNLNLSYVFVYRGKELYSRTISGYFYGSIGVSYLLK